MADNMTREERGKQMALIHNKNTKPELELKHLFWHLGYHYRYSNWKQLPGKPDLVFVGRKKVVFLHGCFWHRHPGCPLIHVCQNLILNFGRRNCRKMFCTIKQYMSN